MAKKRRNGGGMYAAPLTIGNGTLSYETSVAASEVNVTVGDLLDGIGFGTVPTNPSNLSVSRANNVGSGGVVIGDGSVTITVPRYHYYTFIDWGETDPGSMKYYDPSSVSVPVDAIKVSSVTAAPNQGTRQPIEVNFMDGQLFRCDNAVKATKVKPSSRSPAGLWQDVADRNKVLFTLKGSNNTNKVRIGVAVRQF